MEEKIKEYSQKTTRELRIMLVDMNAKKQRISVVVKLCINILIANIGIYTIILSFLSIQHDRMMLLATISIAAIIYWSLVYI